MYKRYCNIYIYIYIFNLEYGESYTSISIKRRFRVEFQIVFLVHQNYLMRKETIFL